MMRHDVTLHAHAMTFTESNMRPAQILFAYGFRDWTRILRTPRDSLVFVGCVRDGSVDLPRCLTAVPHEPAPEEGPDG